MKKFNKIVSSLLAVLMMLGSMTVALAVNVSADEVGDGTDGEIDYSAIISKKTAEDYTEKIYKNEDEKIASMTLKYRGNGFKLYADEFSGEVAIVNESTGEKLFTNPWDVASDKSSNTTTDDSTTGSIKEQLLSQIEISFTDITGKSYTYSSFRMAALKEQINVKNIKGGIRVEYSIGREQSKMLVPFYIEASRFENLIKKHVVEGMNSVYGDRAYFYIEKFLAYYTPLSRYEVNADGEFVLDADGNKIEKSASEQKQLFDDFPALKEIDLMYTLSTDGENKISSAELTMLEQDIKTYCSDYTYEELEYDHEMTQYVSEDENPPLFKMALEYTVDEQGLTVRLPANGIRFDESMYTLKSLDVLPYMGAGSNWSEGYNFMPDGSGALYEFDESGVKTSPTSAYSQVYGVDYAYHSITGTYEKTIRYPVFGTAVSSSTYTYTSSNGTETVIDGSLVSKIESENDTAKKADDRIYKELYNEIGSIVNSSAYTVEVEERKSGFLAIIEEGDALTKIASYHGGNQNDYNSVKMQFTPRPSDTYNLQESLSVSGLGEWTVVSERKYLGNYKIRYVMLSDGDKAADSDKTVYDASWLGMAVAYRDYLTSTGVLSALDSSSISEDIPLYIETFGAIETVERILSIPVTKKVALTSFEDIKSMYEDLSDAEIKNINFKLTGYTKGGMSYTVPKNLKFEKVVGGKKGFQELLDYAAEVSEKDGANLGIFPDFDLAYVINQSAFDGVNIKKQVAKTIDDRYASKRVYSAAQQKYVSYYDLAISPAYFSEFYEKLVDKYLKYDNLSGISIGSLGNALNSDFDEDEPYNREDSKEYTIEAFKYISEKLDGVDVMTSGGNSYTWKYVDHILDVALDSSRQSRSSSSVPFVGVVLHGSKQFAGEPLNMEGDIQYAVLKAIENGASPYFVLSYQNTEKLKESTTLSKYYSIRYDIWKEDLISTYTSLNNVLSDVQDKYIIDYTVIEDAVRVPDTDETEADIIQSIEDYISGQDNLLENIRHEAELALKKAREDGAAAEAAVLENIVSATERYQTLSDYYSQLTSDELDEKGNAVGYIEQWKQNGDKYYVDMLFSYITGTNYKALRQIVKSVEEYVALASEANDTVMGGTTDPYMLAESASRLAKVLDYYNNDRIASSEISDGFTKSMRLLDESEWINGMPTYVFGVAGGKYVFVAGSYERGFDAYYSDGEEYIKVMDMDTLNVILDTSNKLKSDLTGSAKALKGTFENAEDVRSGELVEDGIYRDGNGYYASVTDGDGNIHYIYYTYQRAYSGMLEDVDGMINDIINRVAEHDAEYAQTLTEKYQKASKDTEKKDDGSEDVEDETDSVDSKYAVESIVVVTYGSGNKAYKHVVLNYNNFTVKVVFEGVEYTIPAYSFVAVMAEN